MSSIILKSFQEFNPLQMTEKKVLELKQYCLNFEIKKEHPSALNTNLLAVYPMYFLNDDYVELFDILEIQLSSFTKTIKNIPNNIINDEFKVSSDGYNLLVLWAAHNTFKSNLSNALKHEALMCLFKMLLYKFMTSFTNHMFPYMADRPTMQATIGSLSNKHDIIRYGTWKKDLEARASDIIDPKSIHYKTLITFDDDKKITYILSDTQSRIRAKIVTIAKVFHKMKERGDAEKTYQLAGEIDGEKVLKQMSNSFVNVVEHTYVSVMNTNSFINNLSIKYIESRFSNVKADTFKRILMIFSTTAVNQSKLNEFDKLYKDKKTGDEYYIGIRGFVQAIVQKNFRYAMLNRIPVDSKIVFLERMKEIYSSSRMSDPDILMIKRSAYKFVADTKLSTREATISSLSIGLILYILIKSFDHIR